MDVASKPAAGNGSYRRLLALAKPYRGLLLAGLLAMGVEAAAGAGFTLMMKPIINQTFIARNSQVSLLLPQSRARVDAALAAYGAGSSSLKDVLDARRMARGRPIRDPKHADLLTTLKTGWLLGAKPRHQLYAQLCGVVVCGLVALTV